MRMALAAVASALREGRAMGSPLRLTVAGAAVAAIDELWASVTADVESTEAALSRFRAASDLSRLNVAAGSGAWQPVSDRVRHCLAISHRAGRVTGGRFDSRVIVRLEALGERGGVDLPLALPGSSTDRWLELDRRHHSARLSVPIDSGGVGKGLALRWAAAVLARRRVDRFLLEAGGDIVVHGDASDGGAWRIGVEDPHRSGGPVAVIALRRGAVVTSSTMVRHWTAPDGAEVHHLIDPATGEPADGGLAAVTVAGPDPAWAEVWSKALFLAGRRGIGPEARRRGIAAWWVESDGASGMTPAARAMTSWARIDADP
jgi:thiamine biosynthesis lipoprotein